MNETKDFNPYIGLSDQDLEWYKQEWSSDLTKSQKSRERAQKELAEIEQAQRVNHQSNVTR